MQLGNHPKLRHQWPPVWRGFRDLEYMVSAGEKPDKLLSVEESELVPEIILTAKYEGQKLIGRLNIEDSEFRVKVLEVLRQNIGKSIKEIGSLDLTF